MTEEWRVIDGWDAYEVSDEGRIRRCKGGSNGTFVGRLRILARSAESGYLAVDLKQDGRSKTFRINRLVCLAFIGPPPTPVHDAAHGDGSRDNNRLSNLRWATKAENQADRKLHGTSTPFWGSTHPMVILTEDQVKAIRAEPRKWGYQTRLADHYSVCQQTISDIITGRTWSHLP